MVSIYIFIYLKSFLVRKELKRFQTLNIVNNKVFGVMVARKAHNLIDLVQF